MSQEAKIEDALKGLLEIMPLLLNERERRLFLGCAAYYYGYGGQAYVSKVSGVDARTVHAGIDDLTNNMREQPEDERIRRKGAGRPSKVSQYPEIAEKVEELLESSTFGDSERVIKWTNLSLEDISTLLKTEYSIEAGRNVVSRLIEELGYSKQVNQKMMQVGDEHQDRDAQFCHINETAKGFLDAGDPVISVDTKKKELIGNFKNDGAEYRPQKDARAVLDHDFAIPELGKVAPYGVYLLNDNTGFVNLGQSHDTSTFAVESIRRWWNIVGKSTFPDTKRIYINCDGGGSNGWRVRLWKYELALLAEETGLEIHVSHFPPGTSKWNKIEHRLFCYISRNWAGKPLIDIATVVNLIGSTTTSKGLKVKCVVDDNSYETSIKVSDDKFVSIDMERVGPNSSWNYIIRGFKKYI